jgi:antitoxin component YwqK of YwqJK toxin-antitoxin module
MCSDPHTETAETQLVINADHPDLSELRGDLYLRDTLFSGLLLTLHSNGDTAVIMQYKEGKKSGRHRGWYPNGNKKFSYSYENGEFHGTCIEWFESGTLYRISNYKNGREAGMQTVWNLDETLYANYEARNGRKYGLTGTKHCINEEAVRNN